MKKIWFNLWKVAKKVKDATKVFSKKINKDDKSMLSCSEKPNNLCKDINNESLKLGENEIVQTHGDATLDLNHFAKFNDFPVLGMFVIDGNYYQHYGKGKFIIIIHNEIKA